MRSVAWWSRVAPVPLWALAGVAVMLAVVGLSWGEMPGAWARAGALGAPVVAIALSRSYPLVSLGIAAVTSVATGQAWGEAVPVWTVALGAASGVVSFLAGRRLARAAPALVVFGGGVLLATAFGAAGSDAFGGIFLLAVAVVLPWAGGRFLRQQAELVDLAAERARLQERARIACDMHDTLGHDLSLLALRAGALEIAPGLPQSHRSAAAELRAGAGLATARLAEVIRLVRDGEPATLEPSGRRIEDLVEQATGAGLPVSLEWHGSPALPPMVQLAAYRVVQEGLTNAAKHAPGSAIRVQLCVADAATTVTVTNPFAATARPGMGGRAGLVALRERVRLAGGQLDAGTRDGTFRLVATLPHEEYG
jgi:signal transduction histidine kinase